MKWKVLKFVFIRLFMRQSKIKKLRQMYKREFREKLLNGWVHLPSAIWELIKPKPKWMPQFLWVRLIKLVLKIDEVENGNKTNQNHGAPSSGV